MCSSGGTGISYRACGKNKLQEHVIRQAVHATYVQGVQALAPRAFQGAIDGGICLRRDISSSHRIHTRMAHARHDDRLRAHPRNNGNHSLPSSIRGPKMQATWNNKCLNRNRGQDGTGRRSPTGLVEKPPEQVCLQICISMENGPQPNSPNTAAPGAPAGQESRRRHPIAALACPNDGWMDPGRV